MKAGCVESNTNAKSDKRKQFTRNIILSIKYTAKKNKHPALVKPK